VAFRLHHGSFLASRSPALLGAGVAYHLSGRGRIATERSTTGSEFCRATVGDCGVGGCWSCRGADADAGMSSIPHEQPADRIRCGSPGKAVRLAKRLLASSRKPPKPRLLPPSALGQLERRRLAPLPKKVFGPPQTAHYPRTSYFRATRLGRHPAPRTSPTPETAPSAHRGRHRRVAHRSRSRRVIRVEGPGSWPYSTSNPGP